MEYRGVYRWAAIWIGFCVWCQCVPWVLSAIGQLNRNGYLVALAVSLPLAWFFGRAFFKKLKKPGKSWSPRRWMNRMKRQPVFAVWLFLLGAALIGGTLYPPTNHDGLTYRFPRILHWFWEGQWHWIENPAEPQMNLSTHGFEWLSGFLFALTKSDRFFFLINVVSFVLLPGLLFAFLTRVGISGRVASWWMWLFPAGYGIALQAGSIGNDLFAVPYVLAGMVFALRARESKQIAGVCLAILAAALVTGTKLSNAPLVLPIAVALAFNLPWLLRWRNAPTLVGATSAGLVASAAPVMLACTLYTGHFGGDPENVKSLNVENPAAGLVANTMQVGVRNAMPPVNPVAGWWNRHYREWIPKSVADLLAEDYPRFHLNLVELPQEEGDGLGLGISLLALICLGLGVASTFHRRDRSVRKQQKGNRWIALGIALATLVYLLKMGSEAAPRLMLPYYSLLLMLVLGFAVNGRLIRQPWWKFGATAAACFVLPAVVLSPNRPMLPMQTILAALPAKVQETGPVERMATVFATYAERYDAMAPLRQWLPESGIGSNRIAFIGGGRSLRTGLWRPFGKRKVEHFQSLEVADNQSVSAYVVDMDESSGDMTVDTLRQSADWELKGIASIPNYAGKPPERYAVLVPVKTEATSLAERRE